MTIGLVILLAGCMVAIYRSGLEDDRDDRGREARELLSSIPSDFASGSGALSLSMLASGQDRVELKDGRSAMIRVDVMDGSSLTLYIPDRDSYEGGIEDGRSITTSVIPVSMDDGRVIPGRLEVTLVG